MSLHSISPVDGRYHRLAHECAAYFSEAALMKYRTHVEVAWLIALSATPHVPQVRALTSVEREVLAAIVDRFDRDAPERVKEIEQVTNHDVKAIEYYIKENLAGTTLGDVVEWVHFGCTSEDINNLAHALMLKGGIRNVWLPMARNLTASVATLAHSLAEQPMLAHTHGQAASPTTIGKELAVFVHRWGRQLAQVERLEYLGKFNGAVGNWNAHVAAFPDAPWPQIARDFVESLGLTYNPLTTQIESHDYISEAFQAIIRFDNILIDFVRDIWTYISMGYFKQRVIAGEVGSSTMPHKVNPIDFENAEANLGIANAILDHLANKLPISRLQRDLTDSSALRNMGVGIAHSFIALRSTNRGLGKLTADPAALARDLNQNWVVLAEPIQTVMRKNGHDNPYETLKGLTRGATIGEAEIRAFVAGLDLPADDKARLMAMTPASYVGLAAELAEGV